MPLKMFSEEGDVMNCYCGLFEDHADTAHMTEDELFDYAVDRMHVMLKLERMAERHLAQKDTPMQRSISLS